MLGKGIKENEEYPVKMTAVYSKYDFFGEYHDYVIDVPIVLPGKKFIFYWSPNLEN